jgi:serine/threonine protein kinase
VMELLCGGDMSEVRHKQPNDRLPMGVCVHFAKQMVTLLEKLHSLGVIHRDIKPK